MILRKPLFLLLNGDKFLHQGEIYTVFQHADNMTEVFKNGKFWAWPSYNGKGPIMVDYTTH
jgi:hypothetical protein